MTWRGHLLLFVVLVPTFNTLAVLALPYVINRYVQHRVIDQAMTEAVIPSDDPVVQARKAQILERGAVNVALPAPRADANARTVVRPSPDLLYTACLFDLDAGPLHVVAPVPDSYLSVSGFAADTSNFFALNDRDGLAGDAPRTLDLWVISEGMAAPEEAARTIVAPSRRGLILFRMLLQDQFPTEELKSLRAGQRCEPLPKTVIPAKAGIQG